MNRERRPSSAVDTAATQQRRRSGTEETTALEVAARSLLLSSIRTIGSGTGRLVYPASSCDGDGEVAVDGVVDSTTTLVAARALSKLGRSDLAWDFLRTMFAAQGSDGFMPRFAYLNRTTTGGHPSRGRDGKSSRATIQDRNYSPPLPVVARRPPLASSAKRT